MKVLFVVPKLKSMFGDTDSVPGHPHVGIAYLTAFLQKSGHQVSIFDNGLEEDDRELFSLIKEFEPDLIGVTVFSYCYKYAFELINKIKEQTEGPLVIGGPHVSAVKSKALEETGADFAVKGEGEYALLELLEELAKKHPRFTKIRGLLWRDRSKKIIENDDRPFIQDLDTLPFPDYYSFKIEQYPCFEVKTLPLLTSRGCPYGCNYCSVRLSMGRGFRPRSPENVVKEIEYWYRKGWRSFDINDDCFTLDMRRTEKICDLIVDRNLKILFQLYNGIRVDRVNRELLQKLKDSGCTFIAYGCETGNEETMRVIKKNIKLQEVRKAVEWTNEIGIKNAVNFIIGHPAETLERAMDTIRFAQSLPTNFVNFYNLVPYPGTEVFEWAKKNARFLYPVDTFLKDISYRDSSPIFETNEFTKEERQQVMKLGFELYEKKVLQFRLGNVLGRLVYLMTRNSFLGKTARTFALSNRVGRKIYLFLSRGSRK